MIRRMTKVLCRLGATAVVIGSIATVSAYGQQMPPEYDQAMKTLGKQGDFKDNVLKINIPQLPLTESQHRRHLASEDGWR